MGQALGIDACCCSRSGEEAGSAVLNSVATKELFLQSRALIFIKPNAMTDPVKALVRQKLKANQVRMIHVGEMMGAVLDSTGLIDRHFGPIASKAVKLQPKELVVKPKKQEEFLRLFGLSWADALEQRLVVNASTAVTLLNVSAEEFIKRYDSICRDTEEIKFGHGFYCGKIGGIFVINGFYLKMRAKYTSSETSVLKYEVTWQTSRMSWSTFRKQVIGETDPSIAVEGSLRQLIYRDWRSLGLQAQPDTVDNALHVSAGAFEAAVERANWLNNSFLEDPICKVLQAQCSVKLHRLEAWALDPPVLLDNQRRSVFDIFMDKSASEVVELAKLITKDARNLEAIGQLADFGQPPLSPEHMSSP